MSINPLHLGISALPNGGSSPASAQCASAVIADSQPLPCDGVELSSSSSLLEQSSAPKHTAAEVPHNSSTPGADSATSAQDDERSAPLSRDAHKLFETMTDVRREEVLVAAGTDGNDEIFVTMNANKSLIITINGEASYLPESAQSRLIIDGGAGNDRIIVDKSVTADLRITGGEGDDYIISGSGHDRIFDNYGSNYIDGGAGHDVIVARGADVWPDGRGFVNQLFGGEGNDYIEGGDGNDLIQGGAGYDVLYGLGGDDEIHGGEGSDYIDGGSGNDRLFGEAGNDNLLGGQGDDAINGGIGDDLLVGASGSDSFDASSGANRIISSGAEDTVLAASAQTTTETLTPIGMPHHITSNGDRSDRARIDSDLEALASLPHGQKMFSEIAQTGHRVDIELTPDGSACASFAGNTQRGVGSDSQIFYNASKIALSTDMPWANRAPIVSLYHEMCHSYNAAVGNMDKGWYQKDGTKMPNGEGTPGLEYQAVGIDVPGIEGNDPLLTENGLRDLLGYQKREEY
ncbi:MAG: M91 family zinc metallopeptidase [bacterium]|nr:M91 family zinc metallopeptidase [bacterium]